MFLRLFLTAGLHHPGIRFKSTCFYANIHPSHYLNCHQRIESHLEDLRGGDDWRDMCSTTPADFLHLHFDGPHMCVDWVWFIFVAGHLP